MKLPPWLGGGGRAGKWVGGIYIDLKELGRKIEWCRDGGIEECFYPSQAKWEEEIPREAIRQLPDVLVAEILGCMWEMRV